MLMIYFCTSKTILQIAIAFIFAISYDGVVEEARKGKERKMRTEIEVVDMERVSVDAYSINGVREELLSEVQEGDWGVNYPLEGGTVFLHFKCGRAHRTFGPPECPVCPAPATGSDRAS